MGDALFTDPRLVAVYDAFDGERDDLEAYRRLVRESAARSVLDIGCGTGTFALLLAGGGLEVVGVDPAAASIDVARAKDGAAMVRWVIGDAGAVDGDSAFDIATMTGNVAQAIVDPLRWRQTLMAARRLLRPGGRLVFETRDPAVRSWEAWTREASHSVVDVDGIGVVEAWVELTSVDLPLVSFRWTFFFHADGVTLTSDSTLRFRERSEIEEQLAAAGFVLEEVRGAPDRPGRELVFIARSS